LDLNYFYLVSGICLHEDRQHLFRINKAAQAEDHLVKFYAEPRECFVGKAASDKASHGCRVE